MVVQEEKQRITDAIENGFGSESRVLGIAYALKNYENEYSEDVGIAELRKKFKLAVENSGLTGIVENQIDYYCSLMGYEGELIWEEREKIDELELGISAMLDMGLSCDQKFIDIFELKKIKPEN